MDVENIISEINYYDEVDYYDDILWPFQNRLPKVYIRDATNPFELPTQNFKKRFRFNQESVLYIVSLIRNNLVKSDNRGLPVAPEIAVLLTLRYYATASFQVNDFDQLNCKHNNINVMCVKQFINNDKNFQLVCGDLISLSQPTVSNVVTKVSRLLALLHKTYIKIPTGDQASINRQLFKDLGRHGRWPGLPGIDGAIDCTHIRIVNTPGCQHHEVYRNRKSYFSINVQAVVGPQTEFLDIVARWAGSTHDSRIFQMSRVYMKYTQGVLNGKLVGDSGYPTLPFMLTPIRPTPEDPPQIRYNRAQIKTRNIVERTFGIWKRRFPCLSKGLGNKLQTVSLIIVACAVLHNLSLILNDNMALGIDSHSDQEDGANETTVMASTSAGFVVRSTIIENYYQ
nr:putative nuclease HARBI1 isoform X1 [Helicoverpa armigera]